jgi:branched-chain amino acid transport system permease protein
MSRGARNFLLGALGLLLITAPFIWFKLDYNFTQQTVQLRPALQRGLAFFQGLGPAFAVAALVAAWGPLKKRAGLPDLTERWPAAWQKAGDSPWFYPGTLAAVLVLGFFLDAKSLNNGIYVGLFMLQALGLNIITGMTGLLVLGYAGFFAFGAYAFAVGQILLPGLPWWLALPLVFAAGGGVGWLVGLPCLRLRGDYLALVTLGFAESFRELMRNLEITGGDKGISLNLASKIQGFFGCSGLQITYWVVAAVVALSVLVIHRLYHSPIGRAWIAIREDETAAGAMGVPVTQMKLLAFALSSAFAALAGVLYVSCIGFVDPDACAFEQSVLVLAMVILGGLGSIPGALLGSSLLYLIPTLLRDQFPSISDYRLLLFGVIMVVMMLYRPQGLLGSRRRELEVNAK